MAIKPELRDMLVREYIKCAKDPVYFMKKYCYIQHPQRGRVIFNLYPFQEKVLTLFKDQENIIVLKSRQLGISTLAAGYSLWLMTFHKDKQVLALATTQDTARNLVTKVSFMYENLPKWMQLPATTKNKLSLILSNGSGIEAKSSSPHSARGMACSLLLVDEAAFIDNIAETFTAAQQTLATGGSAMILSTPNGVGNWYHQMWEKAENGENTFLPVRLPWTVHPERDQAWRDKQNADLGTRMAAQECDADFLTSGDTFFELEDILYMESTYSMDPLERRGVDGNLWIWQPADYTRSYMVSADVSRGDSEDYSAFHIIDLETCEQVGEYKGKISPKDFGNLLVGIGTEYNNALLVVENASIGWATIEQILERGYNNLYYSSRNKMDTVESYMKKYDRDQLVPGFINSVQTRPLLTDKGQQYVREKSVVIHSKRTLSEMRAFVWKNGKPQAQPGYNDDLVMSLCIGLYIRDTALRMRQQGLDIARKQMDLLSTVNTRPELSVYNSRTPLNNPYRIQLGNGEVEDTTWVLG